MEVWRAGDATAARAAFAAVHAADPRSAKAWFLDAALAIEAGQLDDAETALGHVAVLQPGWAVARFWLGQLVRKQGRIAEARAHFAAAGPDLTDFVPLHLHAGSAALEAGDADAAVAAFTRATELAPTAGEAWGMLGLALDEAKDLPAALAALRRAAEAEPLASAPWVRLGWVLGRRKLHAEAAEAYAFALKRDPGDATAWLNLGLLRARMKDLPGAQAAFAGAVQADPLYEDGHFWLAASRAGTDQNDAARADFAALAARHPRNPLLVAIRDAFDQPGGAL